MVNCGWCPPVAELSMGPIVRACMTRLLPLVAELGTSATEKIGYAFISECCPPVSVLGIAVKGDPGSSCSFCVPILPQIRDWEVAGGSFYMLNYSLLFGNGPVWGCGRSASVSPFLVSLDCPPRSKWIFFHIRGRGKALSWRPPRGMWGR